MLSSRRRTRGHHATRSWRRCSVWLAVAVARGPGYAAVGRGEAVAAGDVLWVWAEVDTIAAPTTASVAPNRRDVFIGDKD